MKNNQNISSLNVLTKLKSFDAYGINQNEYFNNMLDISYFLNNNLINSKPIIKKNQKLYLLF